MKEYINFNTEKRTNATNSFEKDLWQNNGKFTKNNQTM